MLYGTLPEYGLWCRTFTPVNLYGRLWFIFVIAGLYIILPLLKRMTDNMTKREAEYFLALNFVLTFLPTTLSDFEVFNPFVQYISKFEISFATGYIGLFVLGWYIDSFEHGKRLRVSLFARQTGDFLDGGNIKIHLWSLSCA